MPTTTNLSIFYWNPLDPASADIWGDDVNDAIIALDGEFGTRTINQDYADFDLSRAKFKDYSETLQALGNISGAQTFNIANGNHISMTLTGDASFTISNAPPSGTFGILVLYVTQDGTGGRTLTFPAAFEDNAGSNFVISDETASALTQVVAWTIDGGTKWHTKQGDTWA